jgi:hypothetical protein
MCAPDEIEKRVEHDPDDIDEMPIESGRVL